MTDQPEEIICDCSGTTKAKIHQLIKDGKDSFEKIASATGAATGCGSCDVLIMDILAEKNIVTPTGK
ncbi:MAG: (2Fe-2S)-binding protein [Pseudomonadota bacterium]|nr:(2Fe-2S)-binding protein [Pseudomonadota bacterium]